MLQQEQIHQINLMNWLQYNMPEVKKRTIHVANERTCSPQHGRILKRMGVKRGVADIFIPMARKGKHGLFIELKVGTNKPSKEQLEFLSDMASEGYQAAWVIGWEKARDLIVDYFKSPLP